MATDCFGFAPAAAYPKAGTAYPLGGKPFQSSLPLLLLPAGFLNTPGNSVQVRYSYTSGTPDYQLRWGTVPRDAAASPTSGVNLASFAVAGPGIITITCLDYRKVIVESLVGTTPAMATSTVTVQLPTSWLVFTSANNDGGTINYIFWYLFPGIGMAYPKAAGSG